MSKQYVDKFELLYSDLLDLHNRLVLDYAGDQKFEQFEEDRLVIGNLLDAMSEMIEQKENNKTISITGYKYLKSDYDLYELYTDFLIDHDDKISPLSYDEVELCEEIRENYGLVFESIPSGRYSLVEFEELAKYLLDKERKQMKVKDLIKLLKGNGIKGNSKVEIDCIDNNTINGLAIILDEKGQEVVILTDDPELVVFNLDANVKVVKCEYFSNGGK